MILKEIRIKANKMVNYQNGKVYRIVCNENDLVYYGSTTQPLSKRFYEHKKNHKLYLEGKYGNVSSFEIVKYDSCKVILVEDCPCDRKEQLLSKERFYIENNPCVNKNIPGRTHGEYYQDNKELCLKKSKEYRENNKEKLDKYYIEYKKNNQEKIKESRQKYYSENIEKIREKDRIRGKVKYICECGVELRKDSKFKHLKSKKHQDFINLPQYVQ